jgi:hypothetical protein
MMGRLWSCYYNNDFLVLILGLNVVLLDRSLNMVWNFRLFEATIYHKEANTIATHNNTAAKNSWWC